MSKYVDYFNPEDVSYEYVLPDGKSKFIFKALKEGDRAWIQNQRSVIEMDQVTRKAQMDASSGDTKREVIVRALTDWDIQTANKKGDMTRVPFEDKNKEQLLINLDPAIIDGAYAVVEEHNTWLQGSVRDAGSIRKEIERLERERESLEVSEKK